VKFPYDGRAKLLNGLTKVDSVAAAGRLAGYRTRQAAHKAMNAIRRAATEELERLKIGRSKVFRKLGAIMEAQKTVLVIKDGMVMERPTVDDNETQLRATIELAKMHGAYAPANVDVKVDHRSEIDFENMPDEDLTEFLQDCNRYRTGNFTRYSYGNST
jgi:hypothetical protein